MKKFLALLLCLVMAFAFVACDDKKKEEPDDDKGGSSSENSSVNYYVEYKGVKISLGADAESVLKALGSPNSEDPQGMCGGVGEVTKYTYLDFLEINIVDAKVKKTIDKIRISSDAIVTPEGIGVGANKEDVINAYGKAYSDFTDTKIVYNSGYKSVIFSLRDGAVVKIEYNLDDDWYK
ncbi:MAG: hypothetical protein E7679_00950 [Ruminococcaceae bacterium]|nr:hypothetical protein [Oscillospiraceae bacterium]